MSFISCSCILTADDIKFGGANRTVLDVTCESLSFRSRRPGLPLSGKLWDPLACAGEKRHRERSMVDLRADTASSSDKAEVTETEDQSRTHHSSTATVHVRTQNQTYQKCYRHDTTDTRQQSID